MKADLAKLRALHEAATPGEWELWTSCSWRRVCVGGMNPQPVIWPTVDSDGHPNLDRLENLELAIAAVNALPELLAIAEAVERAPVVEIGRHAHMGPMALVDDESLVGKQARLLAIGEDG
jgi:hypothetical protein